MRRLLPLVLTVVVALPLAGQSRLASDFEIAEMRHVIATSRDFLARLSARLNLGDLHASRREMSIARDEYGRALDLAQSQRAATRRDSDLTAYAAATAYAGLAAAKLGQDRAAFEMLEEAVRYAAGSAETWNLYATAMTLLEKPQKGIRAARNAVAIAGRALANERSATAALDLAVYRHALATSLVDAGRDEEAEQLLREVIASLLTPTFDAVRRDVERSESFEIYSTARGEAAAYLSLLNRSQLRLAALLEKRGDPSGARETYERVLEQRTDDPTALAALARLGAAGDRERWFAEAFEANPFSPELIREYRRYLATTKQPVTELETTGGRMRRALVQMKRGESRSALATLDTLIARFPANTTLRKLRDEVNAAEATPSFLASISGAAVEPAPGELRQLMALARNDRLTAGQRASLDAMTFRAVASFDAAAARGSDQTVLESGTIGGIPFRFSEPIAFSGRFSARTPYRLSFRFLGVTVVAAADALLVEPLGLETP